MSVFDNNESWLIQRRSGEINDPFISIQEQITIINGRGQFTEVPSNFNGVVIKNTDNTITYNSKDSGIPTTTIFVINYNQGIITADSSFNNKVINVSYFGTGKFLLSGERVFTKKDDYGNIIQTFQDLANGVNNSSITLDNLNNANNIGITLHETLINDIPEATSKSVILSDTINNANIIKTNLDNSNTTALITKNSLDPLITSGNITKTSLDNSNTTALITKNALDSSNVVASESTRITNENIRTTSEINRVVSENIRKSNESDRESTILIFKNWYNNSNLTGRLPFMIDGGDFGDVTIGSIYDGGDF